MALQLHCLENVCAAACAGCGKSTFMRRMTAVFGGNAQPPAGALAQSWRWGSGFPWVSTGSLSTPARVLSLTAFLGHGEDRTASGLALAMHLVEAIIAGIA